jgi:predicted NBD/HSP70 family sugar kinase
MSKTNSASSTAHLRDLNRSAALRLIGTAGPISRAEIARELGLSPATVTGVTRELLHMGFIRVVDQAAPEGGGRPALLLAIVGSAAHALGVKVAADHVVGVRVDLDGGVLERFDSPFDPTAGDSLVRLAAFLRAHVDGGTTPFLGVGLGVPGIVGRDGRVASPMLGWEGVPLAVRLQRELDVPVLVENDVNTLAIAERLYGRGLSHFLTLTVGRGVGLGITIAGEVYRGGRGGAGEFGHVAVDPDGPACECGKRGCLEALVADPALVARARAAGVIGPRQGIERLRALAAKGDTAATAIFAEAGAVLGSKVADLVNVLDPEAVLVSGEGTQSWSQMADSFRRALDANVFPPLRGVPVEVDPWDDANWARGAATLVLRQAFVPAPASDNGSRSVRARLREHATAMEAV